MDQELILKDVIMIVREVTKDYNVNEDSNQQNTFSWDSLAYMVIAQNIEKHFSLPINSNNIDAMDSVSNIVNLIQSENK